MSPSQRSVGFDRKIRLRWLDATAEWAANGMPVEDIRLKLDFLLQGELTGKEALKKTKTVLLRTWVLVPEDARPLQEQGLELLTRRSGPDRLILHWGMAITAYRLLWETAITVGRLLRLQGEVALSQVKRRMTENYGERSTLIAAAQRIIRSFVDWGVLEETEKRGVYLAGTTTIVQDEELLGWLIEAMLLASGSNSGILLEIMKSPALFPFEVSHAPRPTLDKVPRLEVHRQGLDEELVMLRQAQILESKRGASDLTLPGLT